MNLIVLLGDALPMPQFVLVVDFQLIFGHVAVSAIHEAFLRLVRHRIPDDNAVYDEFPR